jgi:hypothetical protein
MTVVIGSIGPFLPKGITQENPVVEIEIEKKTSSLIEFFRIREIGLSSVYLVSCHIPNKASPAATSSSSASSTLISAPRIIDTVPKFSSLGTTSSFSYISRRWKTDSSEAQTNKEAHKLITHGNK